MGRKPIQGDECQWNLIIGGVALIALIATIYASGISSISQDNGTKIVELQRVKLSSDVSPVPHRDCRSRGNGDKTCCQAHIQLKLFFSKPLIACFHSRGFQCFPYSEEHVHFASSQASTIESSSCVVYPRSSSPSFRRYETLPGLQNGGTA
jgi:hypothetical protein